MARAATPALALLARAGVPVTTHPYTAPGVAAYGTEAAEALDLDPHRVFKTLVAEVDGTGYVTGGISPLGTRQRLPLVLDNSALGFPTIFCSAGKRGLQMELAPDDLVATAGGVTAAVAGV